MAVPKKRTSKSRKEKEKNSLEIEVSKLDRMFKLYSTNSSSPGMS